MTLVVNLFGGPGVGKSTTAAKIFSDLKQQKISCELVREYVKDWAWGERRVTPLDQLHLLGEQSYRESLLYGKVDVILTDSPLLLCAFYQNHYGKQNYLLQTVSSFMDHAKNIKNVKYLNLVLSRTKEYDPKGRFETEDEAIDIDSALTSYLLNSKHDFMYLDSSKYDKILELIVNKHFYYKAL